MSLNASKVKSPSNKKRTPPLEAGAYPARLVGVALLGVQKNRPFKDEEPKPPCLHVRVTYELLDEFLKDDEGEDILDKPRWVSETFSFLSLKADRAKSTLRYYALDPEALHDGDWEKLIGAPCMVNIIVEQSKKDKEIFYEKVASVSSMRPKEAAKAGPLVNPPVVFDFYDPNMEVFNKFPDWIKDLIRSAVDYPDSKLAALDGAETKPKEKVDEGGSVKDVVDKSAGDDEEDW